VSLWNPARLLKEHCADRPNQMKSLALALAALVSGVASANSALLAFKGGIESIRSGRATARRQPTGAA
jgi:hypothetical protein